MIRTNRSTSVLAKRLLKAKLDSACEKGRQFCPLPLLNRQAQGPPIVTAVSCDHARKATLNACALLPQTRLCSNRLCRVRRPSVATAQWRCSTPSVQIERIPGNIVGYVAKEQRLSNGIVRVSVSSKLYCCGSMLRSITLSLFVDQRLIFQVTC
jgi:hypothetical protein